MNEAPIGWILWLGTLLPLPIIARNDTNLYVKLPGSESVRVVPFASEGKRFVFLRPSANE